MRLNQGQEFVIGGSTPAGRNFDAIIFGYHDEDGRLRYAARTRNGFTPASVLRELQKRPEALAHKKLVIWTFADRGIVAVKAWEAVPLPAP